MRALARLRSIWWNVFRRADVERALDVELASYVEMAAAEYEAKGLDAAAARRAARIDAGGVEQIKESTRDAWAGNVLANAAREARYVIRSLSRSRGYVIVAVATLGIGIGGATAIFSILNAVLLRPLPAVARPEQLVTIESVTPTGELWDTSYPDYLDFRAQAGSLQGIAAYEGTSMAMHDTVGDDRAWVSYVSDNFFRVLGVHAALGRVIGEADVTAIGANPVVVLRYDYWQSRYAANPGVLGRTLTLNGQPFTIIGVAPPGFIGAMQQHHMQVWIPFTMIGQSTHEIADDVLRDRATGWVRLIGRLRDGRTVKQARQEVAGIAGRLAAAYPEDRDRGVLVSAGAGMTADERVEAARLPKLIGAAVALLLIISCANVAGLSLVRTTAKRREMATRLALGASRASLVRHLALEATAIGVVASTLGWLVAQLLVRSAYLVQTIGGIAPSEVRPDGRVLALAIVVGLATAVAVAVVPALHASRTRAGLVMKDGAGGALRRTGAQRGLIVVQISASLVLLAASSMVFSAFHRALTSELGYSSQGAYHSFVNLRDFGYDSTNLVPFYSALIDRAKADPRFGRLALATAIPPADWERPVSLFREGEAPPVGSVAAREARDGARSYLDVVSGNLFETMGIPILGGRTFDARDDRAHPGVIVVDRRLAAKLWPGRDPIGQRVVWVSKYSDRKPLTVVGVVGDVRYASITADPAMVAYIPFTQHPGYQTDLSAVTRPPSGIAPTAVEWQRLVAAIDPRVTVGGIGDMPGKIAGQVAPQRIASTWIGVFGVIALLLAAIGLYGVVAQSVLQRTRELAVRAALGATPSGLSRLVVGDGMRLAGVGAVLGCLAALLGVRFLERRFQGVSAVDARAVVAAAAALATIMLLAAYLPARRAARLNPVDALRSD